MKTTIKQIFGNWNLGYALDKHMISSTPIGENQYGHMQFDNKRTEVGEAVYQLKYKRLWDQAEPLAATILQVLGPRFKDVGLVIPMAASNARARQSVESIQAIVARPQIPK
jgi:predicted amidophosphoribosyltransferase